MTKLYLFVKEDCRPCYMVKKQLERVDNWQQYVTLVEVGPGEKQPLLEEFGVDRAPTLVAVKPDGNYMKFTAPSKMTKSFWDQLFTKLKEEE